MELQMDDTAAPAPPALLAALVSKQGVGLGTLTPAQRELALAIAASALPTGATEGFSEAEVNQALKRCLQAEAAFLATDHVELRRWLVDSGHWRRDGYGRRYERAPLAELLPERADALRALAGLDLPAWVAAQRALDAERRQARRQAWEVREGEPRPPGPRQGVRVG
jgi:CO/xanthine dehydrogenase Mo-binding subunit